MKQYNLGRWVGLYYTQLQYSASYMVFFSFVMLATTVWTVAREQIVNLLPWLSFPLFAGALLLLLLVVMPVGDYFFMMKTRTTYQNEQVWRHGNPVKEQLDRMEEELLNSRKELHEHIFKQGRRNYSSCFMHQENQNRCRSRMRNTSPRILQAKVSYMRRASSRICR